MICICQTCVHAHLNSETVYELLIRILTGVVGERAVIDCPYIHVFYDHVNDCLHCVTFQLISYMKYNIWCT